MLVIVVNGEYKLIKYIHYILIDQSHHGTLHLFIMMELKKSSIYSSNVGYILLFGIETLIILS